MILGVLACLAALPLQAPPGLQLVRAWEVAGTSADGRFGSELAFLGDIDFDGIADLLVSAPGARHDEGRAAEGLVHLLSGADGRVLWVIHGDEEGQALGRGLAVLDDVNIDGRPDFAVLSAADLPEKEGEGWITAITIHSGRDGSVLRRLVGSQGDERLGGRVVVAGDVDGDGHVDLLAGLVPVPPVAVAAPARPGRAALFSSASGRELQRFTGATWGFGLCILGRSELGAEQGVAFGIADETASRLAVWSAAGDRPTFEAELPVDQFAWGQAAPAGDMDGDGRSDFVVRTDFRKGTAGAPPPRRVTRFALQSGLDGHLLGELSWREVEKPAVCALASLPDLDGDGLRELVLGDPLDYAGRGVVDMVHPVSGQTLLTLRGGQVKRWFGAALATCDVLGDELGPGLAIGSVDDDRGATNGGAVALYTLQAIPRKHR